MWKYKRELSRALGSVLLFVCLVGGLLITFGSAEGGPSDGNLGGLPGSDMVISLGTPDSNLEASTVSTVPIPEKEPEIPVITTGDPVLQGISIHTGDRGQVLEVELEGTNFAEISSVTFGPGVRVVGFSESSTDLIKSSLQIDWTAALGKRDVVVSNAKGSSTLTGGFSVGCPVPIVNSVSTSRVKAGGSLILVITGSGFIDASDIDCGEGTTASNFTVSSYSTISTKLVVGKKVSLGDRDVSVTTPGGTGFLRGALTVSGKSSNLNGLSSKVLPGGLLVAGVLSILSWKKRTLLWCTLASSSWLVLAILCAVGKMIEFEIVGERMSIVGAVSFLVIAILVLLLQLRPKEAEVVRTPAETGKPRSYRQLKAEADEKRRELRKRMLH
jgi:hypothetical protein